MGTRKDQDVGTWIDFQNSKWQDLMLNGEGRTNFYNSVGQSTNPRLSSHINPCGQIAGGSVPHGFVASKQVVLPSSINPCRPVGSADVALGIGASEFIHLNLAFSRTLDPMNLPPARASQRQFVIFDQSCDRTRLMFTAERPPTLPQNPTNVEHPNCYRFQEEPPVNDDLINQSVKTSIGNNIDEMCEDTDEIDALLYSHSEDEEEASTGRYSPIKRTGSDEEVAASGLPTKRRRLNDDIDGDPSLMDTATSVRMHEQQRAANIEADGDDELSSANGMTKMMASSVKSDKTDKSVRKDRIHETLGVLRRLIPGGGDGKDATAVIDEAIKYLKSLKANVFEAVL